MRWFKFWYCPIIEDYGVNKDQMIKADDEPDVDVALHDGVVDGLVDAARFHAEERGLEEGLGAAEALVADGDDLTVGQLVALLQGGGRGGGGHLLLEVQGDVAELLLDVADDFSLGCGGDKRMGSTNGQIL
jgi:hypothetical protein